MAKFIDRTGREWEMVLTVGDLPRLRDAGLNLGAALRDPNVWAALADPETFGRVVWVLCSEQAAERGVSAELLWRSFDGATLGRAEQALRETLADFIHRRPEVARAAVERLGRDMDRIAAAQTAALTSDLTGSNGIAGNSPESLESIRERLASEA